ncbi:MAG: hypothetical protein GY822_02060, partial [Deltaproteobacteria bacterium]|nr:hypothetical protein [Deltaproteobacteria bacterium]
RQEVVDVYPDGILVKPMPEMALDYFLTRDVYADDPFTANVVEPPEPFTLGVRIRNNGSGVASQVELDTAQPTIVDNDLELLIDFRIISSEVDGQPAQQDLKINFGDIAPQGVSVGRWQMVSTLPGQFTEFTATVAHSDELGGQLTSLIPNNPLMHNLVRDVLVDLPGRDGVRDFLADDITTYRVYESNGVDTDVEDVSPFASLNLQGTSGTQRLYDLDFPATGSFVYARLADPFNGLKPIHEVRRSDGKLLPSANFWLSKERATNNIDWNYFVNFFDSNTGGRYSVTFDDPLDLARPPIWQTVSPITTFVGDSISVDVYASDPDGGVLTLTALDLPAGANLADNGNNTGTLTWSPSAPGQFNIRLRANDGTSTTTTLGIITVNSASDIDGDGLDDAWEMATFGSLDEDADGDFDGDGISNIDEYLLWVANGNNFVPVANDDTVFGLADAPLGVAVLSNDTDDDPADTLTIDSVTQGVNGAVTVAADSQTLTYTPIPGFTGVDSFDYTVSDGQATDTATVIVTIVENVEGPYTYHVLNPSQASSPAQVVSLVNGNTISAGATVLNLDRNEVGIIPAIDLPQGGAVSGSGPFEVAGTVDGSDMLVPDRFSANDFVVPLVRDSHNLYLLSPIAAANVTVTVDGAPVAVQLTAGLVAQYNIAAGSAGAALITSDQPILVLHTGFDGVDVTDVYPVPPPVNRGFGVRSNDAVVAALQDNTTVYAYADDGSSEIITLDAGQQQALAAGINDANGQGSGFHLIADQPILATQHGDEGDGSAFYSSDRFAKRFALPLDTQYVAVVCAQNATQVTVDDGFTPQTLICNSDGTRPGKLYFGSPLPGVQFAAGTSISADKPVLVMYESSPIADEHNLLGTGWSNALVQVTPPGDQVSSEGDSVNLQIVASDIDNDPLSYAASDLPPGLAIDASGLISGTLDLVSAGDYTVTVTVDDGIESVDEIFNWTVSNANQAPIGVPVITGTPTQGQTLTADTSGISDADGLGAFAYQWQADAVDIAGATASTHVLTQAEVGSNITVSVRYTDGGGAVESLTSAAVGSVGGINDAPQGAAGIDGTPTQNE